VPFTCKGFESSDPAQRALEGRRAKVVAELRAHPELERTFDAVDVPLKAGPGEPVSVVLAVRHGTEILSGEVRIPRERWNPLVPLTVNPAEEKPQ
jgi:hypothetical protein